MRRLLCVLSLGLLAMVGGCQSVPGEPINESNFNQYIVNHEQEIRRTADITTVAVMTTLKKVEDRQKLAVKLNEVAQTLLTAVQNDNLDLTGLRLTANQLLAEQDPAYRDLGGLVVRSVADLIESKTATFFADLPEDSRRSAIRSLIRAGASGVVDATAAYRIAQ